MTIDAGDGIILRPLEESDLPLTLAWRNKDRVRPSFYDGSVLTMEKHLAWYRSFKDKKNDWVYIIMAGGVPVGMVSIYNISPSRKIAEFGRLMIGEDSHLGKGIARRASAAVVKFAFECGIQWIHLSVKRGNSKAIQIYQKVGFYVCGEIGESFLMVAKSPKLALPKTPSAFGHTVILGSYNRPKYVRQAIESVLRQTCQDFQLIVTDDGSNEETLTAIVDSAYDLLGSPKFLLLVAKDRLLGNPTPNCFNRAVQRINDAIPHVQGRIVHYLADDDWYHEGRFAAFDEAFKDPDVMVAYGREIFVDEVGKPTGGGIWYPSVVDPLNVLDHNQVAHRADVFQVLPKWRDAIDAASDGHWFRDLSKLWRFHAFDKLVAYKRFHGHCMQRTGMASGERREA